MNRSTWKKWVAALLCLGMMTFTSGSLYGGDTPSDGDPDRDRIQGGEGAEHDQDPDRDRFRDPVGEPLLDLESDQIQDRIRGGEGAEGGQDRDRDRLGNPKR